jgi:hypothetical protein
MGGSVARSLRPRRRAPYVIYGPGGADDPREIVQPWEVQFVVRRFPGGMRVITARSSRGRIYDLEQWIPDAHEFAAWLCRRRRTGWRRRPATLRDMAR